MDTVLVTQPTELTKPAGLRERVTQLLAVPPPFWPKFSSPLRSVAVTARVGRILGIAFTLCFVTGLLSHYQYTPWQWLPEPASPSWGYRLTQGLHVITGIASIPLLLVKLWSVYHRLFEWPGIKSLVNALERASIAVLVATSILQLFTGLLNTIQWYPWPWGFTAVHYWLGWIIIGSLILHIAVKIPLIREGLATPVWRTPAAPTPPVETPPPTAPPAAAPPAETPPVVTPAAPELEPAGGLSRRGVLAVAGAGVGIVVVTTAGQVIPALEPISLLAPRKTSLGPQGLPVNKTAQAANVLSTARSSQYRLMVKGPRGYLLTVADIEALEAVEVDLPIACVEGWSKGAHWRGPKLLDLVLRGGGSESSKVAVISLQDGGPYGASLVTDSQLKHAVLATHLNGERLDIDHGYPLRLIAPNRAGVLQTKWLTRIEIRS